jgi:hypothetical protein
VVYGSWSNLREACYTWVQSSAIPELLQQASRGCKHPVAFLTVISSIQAKHIMYFVQKSKTLHDNLCVNKSLWHSH